MCAASMQLISATNYISNLPLNKKVSFYFEGHCIFWTISCLIEKEKKVTYRL